MNPKLAKKSLKYKNLLLRVIKNSRFWVLVLELVVVSVFRFSNIFLFIFYVNKNHIAVKPKQAS